MYITRRVIMTKSGILETRSHLSQIINKVMRGDEHIILRKNVAVAKIIPIRENLLSHVRELIKRTKEIRQTIKKVTVDEITHWKNEGRS
jgi:antitoxin (DNA-binding transcriptional repressor) of toxin-antitoxin stability system